MVQTMQDERALVINEAGFEPPVAYQCGYKNKKLIWFYVS